MIILTFTLLKQRIRSTRIDHPIDRRTSSVWHFLSIYWSAKLLTSMNILHGARFCFEASEAPKKDAIHKELKLVTVVMND